MEEEAGGRFSQVPLGFPGIPWGPLGSPGVAWVALGFPGFPWGPLGSPGIPCADGNWIHQA